MGVSLVIIISPYETVLASCLITIFAETVWPSNVLENLPVTVILRSVPTIVVRLLAVTVTPDIENPVALPDRTGVTLSVLTKLPLRYV